MLPSGWQHGRVRLVAYIALSLCVALILFIDPLIDRPSGLVKLRWFTRKPPSHGLDACSWDYEGSWRIGLATGSPDPLRLNISYEPVLTCATLVNLTAVSFVADPFLFIPAPPTPGQPAEGGGPRALAAAVPPGPNGSTPWFAFFEMKNLARYIGEIGVAVSYDGGTTWRYLGTALSETFHLSFPLVMYDNTTSQYLMFPETSGARDGAVRVYGTSPEEFPFGWRLVMKRRPYDPGWPATRRWFQFGAPAKYVDTAPVWFRGQWWIFTTRVGSPPARQPKYTLMLYTADSLLGEWRAHPANLAGAAAALAPGGRVPYGVDADARTARNGGRPFVSGDALYRWAQDCSRYYGEALVLMRADVANDTSYVERVATRYEPRRDGLSWNAERLHHADVQQLPNGTWVGLLDGDRYVDGMAHFTARERWFVELKALLRRLVVLQLLLVVTAVALLQGWRRAMQGWRAYGSGAGGAGRRIWGFPAVASLGKLARRGVQLPLTVSGGGSAGDCGDCAAGECSGRGALRRRVAAVAVMVAIAVAVAVVVMAMLPCLVYCPRWPVQVRPFPASRHYVPDVPYVDPAAPYDVTNLTVVTGCSASFMDRLENLVASLQYWAPYTRVVVYDLGFTSEQLGQIRCWRETELRRFPWERFPAHLRDLRTYAFKALAFRLALEELSEAVLWLDCGLELRGPLTPVAAALAAHGHVSVQQSTSPYRQGFPLGNMAEGYVRRFFNMSDQEYERIKDLPYCAGGFQGFIRGSAAQKRILDPLVACSLDPGSCIAPPGHNRNQHCYDQTAGTLLIRHNNFSSCLPRELYGTSSTRKTSYDPRASSSPIVVTSRRFRQPKPYRGMLLRQPGCSSDPAANPWRTVASEHIESTISHSSLSKIAAMHVGALADFAVQSASCLGLHVLIQLALWAQALLAVYGIRWPALPWRVAGHCRGGAAAGPAAAGSAAAAAAARAPPLSLVAAASAAVALTSVVVVAVAGHVA
ncbi:hypothetical protein PLESTB_001055600 [Pleodorina starrii]|uniref:Glucosamine inositolphosphorylceramide transferase 1 N-terminal domain-containing protein n=1 Tax=Pleodorina starrii TaxID=330485 RepID=A0A9W6BR36_9CHLO|nr:hypothetical protein PLESTB_001055600 [Pleodorina starrii]